MQDQPQNNRLNYHEHARIKWHCRRGMLELDVLLMNFFSGQYPSLTQAEQQCFCDLLAYPDPQIYAWLLQHELPEDAAIAKIIRMIRNAKLRV